MSRLGLCLDCNPKFGAPILLPRTSAELTHCFGAADEPGAPGLIGSGFYCSCECKRWSRFKQLQHQHGRRIH